MATVKTVKRTQYVITLSSQEALILKAIVQNPPQDSIQETRDLLEQLFHALDPGAEELFS